MMSAARFKELKGGAQPMDSVERSTFHQELESEQRRLRAKQAVKTKRDKYDKWPTRKNDHGSRYRSH